MKRIFKIISRHAFELIIIVALLVAQAMCDLKLPEYTADIVNVGIAQKGIENSIPLVINNDDLAKIDLLLNEEESNIIKDSYTQLTKDNFNDKEYQKLVKKYADGLYVLDADKDSTKLENIFDKVNVLYSSLNDENLKYVLDENIEVFTYLSGLDSPTKLTIINNLENQITEQMPDVIKDTVAISTIETYYENAGLEVEDFQINYILTEGLKMLGLACLIMLLTIITAFLISRVAASISKELRSAVVHKVMSYSNNEFEAFQTSSLITRTTNDIAQVQMFLVMALRIVIFAPIMGLGSLTKVSSSQMSWILGISILCVLSVIIVLFVLAFPKFKIIQNKIDRLNQISREILTGVPVIRAFSTEKHEEKRFDSANKDLTKINLFVNRVMSIMYPTMMLIMNGTAILIVWIGSKYVDTGTMQIGDIMALMTYSMHVIMSFLMFSMISIMFPRAIVSFKRVGEVFNKESSINDPENPIALKEEQRGIVEFKDVYFRYPDAEEDVIENISFKALPGTTTAFIGSTGSGKSTLINLIPRFFDVTAGKILIDGVNIKDIRLKDLRDKIGYVPQKGLLFSGTISSNIGFGLEHQSKEKITNAAKVAQAEEFINEKSDKYSSEISQGGTNVSGGQRQRLAIARAIAKDPEIYIFDDSFSALDFKTDAKLRKALAKITQNSTIFIVAQRISTIMNADQIIVLDQGSIVGKGTHEELLQECEVYKEIALSQLSEEELTNA